MLVKLAKKFEFTHEDSTFSFEWKFKEDSDINDLRKRFEGKNIDDNGINLFYYSMRVGLVNWTGIDFIDADGERKPLPVMENGSIIELHQKAVFESILGLPDLYSKVQSAFIGETGKN
jgi:hypothetical protein